MLETHAQLEEKNDHQCKCKCCMKSRSSRRHTGHSARANRKRSREPIWRSLNKVNTEGSNYDVITSVKYLNGKYGLKKSHYIKKFINCIHTKINLDVAKISDEYVGSLSPWVKVKLFLLLITLSQRGGPEYWLEKGDQNNKSSTNEVFQNDAKVDEDDKKVDTTENQGDSTDKTKNSAKVNDSLFTLTEQIMRQNIKQDFTESAYDENYVFSSIWANFMEGLINHYLEKSIIPRSEMKVCRQLYKPMMKIISLYNEYNELIEKSERNGFLPPASTNPTTADEHMEPDNSNTILDVHHDDTVTKERLKKAQKLLWQARQDIPKTISKELTLLSEMYSTLSADEQDYELDEFVSCAEEYIELEYLPGLINLLFLNCGSDQFWKIMIVLEPFFYYIEDVDDEDDGDDSDDLSDVMYEEESSQPFKPDPRVITLEKICEVAARQKWI